MGWQAGLQHDNQRTFILFFGGKMVRTFLLIVALFGFLTACGNDIPQMGPDGKPLPKLYKLGLQSAADVQFRTLDAVNALRVSAQSPTLVLNAALNAAAATHARDMSVQNRPWHFGSDGSSPIDRVARAGYAHKFVGELISETYETELETLAAWMESPDLRRVLLDKRATELGFSWYQETSGKIWWTLVLGSGPDLEDLRDDNVLVRGE